jgi:DNA ligase-1
MTNVAKIIRELKGEPGRNAKLAILEKQRNNEQLKAVFKAALDPYTTYYIKKIPSYMPAKTPSLSLEDGLRFAQDILATRYATGHEAIALLTETFSKMSVDDASVLARVIEKDLDCGVQESSVNKVWKDLIPTYPCLLAKGFDEKNIARIKYPAYSQLKLDGMRVNVFNNNGAITFRGRSGKTIDLLGVLDDEIAKVLPKGQVFDGELILVEDDGSVMKRSKGNGILNKAIKGTITEEEARKVRVTVWDMIPLADFRKAHCATPYQDRFAALQKVVKGDYVRLVEYKEVKSLDEAVKHFEEMLARGEEGTILKNKKHIWEDTRSKDLVKMKAEKDADLEVVDWVEGTGKYVGMMGALVCRSSDGKVEVSIGSGFSDEQRKELTRKRIVGKIVTVLYNERIASKDRPGVDSLFLPRFVEERLDKSKANSSKEIK